MITQLAEEFAKGKHTGQERKFEKRTYYQHVEKVAEIIKQNKKSHKLNELIAAALLHDTLENTNTTEKELIEKFGELITSIVKELTTDKKESARLGKDKYLAEKMSNPEKMSDWALVIKLADRLDNVSDLHKSPEEFRKKYSEETTLILNSIEEKRNLTKTQRKLIEKIKEKIK